MLTLLHFRCMLKTMKADYLGFKLADGKIFPLMNLKKQVFAKVELQAADNSAGKVMLHFVLTKKGDIVEEFPDPLVLEYDPKNPDDLILHAVRSGRNFISVSLFQKSKPGEAVKMPIRLLSAEEMLLRETAALQSRRRFLKALLGIFTAVAVCAGAALLLVFILPASLTGGLL